MNPRSAQLLAAALAFLLIVLIGATIFFLLNRPSTPTPTPSPSPTGVAGFSPSPTLSAPPTESASPSPGASPSEAVSPSPEPTASPTAEPTPTASPTAEPTPSQPPTPSPTASPSPTPTPTISPTSAQRELRLIDVGIDSGDAETRVERIVTFNVSGQSRLSATLSNASAGGIQLCIWREALVDERECDRGRNIGVEQTAFDAGLSTWHVSMIGTLTQVSPFATLTLRFNSDEPRVTLSNFRYVGAAFPEYNGFEAAFTSGAQADMGIEATFEGEAEPYTLIVQPTGGAPIDASEPTPVPSFEEEFALEDGVEYRVSLRNPEEFTESDVPFVRATLTWP